ncbi:MAG TPA: hypothetical protein VFU11_10235 [Solirubrobacterales bacterium]|nr:hypothetical protein [Solirubrobacterales bacterium]
MSLRLGAKLADQISAVARTDETAVAEAIRAAIHDYIVARVADPEFLDRRKRRMEEDLRILEGLRRPETG